MDSLQVLILSGCLKLNNLTEVSGTLKSLVVLYADGTATGGFPSFISSLTNLQVLVMDRYEQIQSPTWWTSFYQKQPQSLMLPSLANLGLLKEISFRNCNISEVCDDIGALPCLKSLDLSGNNFTKLPGSLSQLSRLESLCLDDCKRLEVLPELQPSIKWLHASQCTSLQEPPRLIHRHSYIDLFLYDCPKVFGNLIIDNQVSMSQTRLIDSSKTSHASTNPLPFLVEYLGIESRIRECFSEAKGLRIVLNGNRIPRWFTNKSEGSHVKVELPPNWCYSKLKGYAFCVVFTPKKQSFSGTPRYFVKNFDGALIGEFPEGIHGNIHIKDTMKISLFIMPIDLRWDDTGARWKEAKNFVTFTFPNDEIYEVKRCGVRLVYDDDDEDLNEILQDLQVNLLTGILEMPGNGKDGQMCFYW